MQSRAVGLAVPAGISQLVKTFDGWLARPTGAPATHSPLFPIDMADQPTGFPFEARGAEKGERTTRSKLNAEHAFLLYGAITKDFVQRTVDSICLPEMNPRCQRS